MELEEFFKNIFAVVLSTAMVCLIVWVIILCWEFHIALGIVAIMFFCGGANRC